MSVALVDCNSFYCSCERVFHPQTRGRPIVVLSNNDGCGISFSQEAKDLGFGQMAEAYFKSKERMKKHGVAVFSSNYTLYDDMSKRVMSILAKFTSDLEVYSVDEAFLSLEGLNQHSFADHGKNIRQQILKVTGLPVGVGISKTKVLSKIANRMAKRHKGVFVMMEEGEIDSVLKSFPIRDVWGIGPAGSRKLSMLDIKTAYDLKTFKNDNVIQKFLTKTGREIQDELRGIKCISMEDVPDKQVILNSRSFGHDVFDKKNLREAIATFTTKAAEKLRQQQGVCFGISVFIHTNRFKDGEQYYGSLGHTFQSGTSDTIRLIKTAHGMLDRIYRPGHGYKKGGVILTRIVPKTESQVDFFNEDPSDNDKLSGVLDEINKRFGPQTIKSAACGINTTWKLVADHKSKRFTTNWDEVLTL